MVKNVTSQVVDADSVEKGKKNLVSLVNETIWFQEKHECDRSG